MSKTRMPGSAGDHPPIAGADKGFKASRAGRPGTSPQPPSLRPLTTAPRGGSMSSTVGAGGVAWSGARLASALPLPSSSTIAVTGWISQTPKALAARLSASSPWVCGWVVGGIEKQPDSWCSGSWQNRRSAADDSRLSPVSKPPAHQHSGYSPRAWTAFDSLSGLLCVLRPVISPDAAGRRRDTGNPKSSARNLPDFTDSLAPALCPKPAPVSTKETPYDFMATAMSRTVQQKLLLVQALSWQFRPTSP